MSLQDFLIHRSGLRSREALVERQKVKPAVQWGPDEPTARPGSFKVSSKMLKVMKDAGMEPDESLFPVQRKAITDIPQDKLPGLVGAKSMDKAQDVIAKSPRKAFNVFLRKLTKVSPKAGKMMRNVPQNNSLMFYVYVTRVSGRDMADIILKRYFATQSSHPGARKSRMEHRAEERIAGADPMFDLLAESRVGLLTVDERTREDQRFEVDDLVISEAQLQRMAEVEALEERRGGKLDGRVYMDVENTQPGDFGGYGGSVRSYAIYVWGNTYPIKDQLKKLGLRFDRGSGKTSRSGAGNRWVMYHRYSANPASRGGSYRGSVSEKKVKATIPKVKKIVDSFNRTMAKKNQRTIASVGYQPEEDAVVAALDKGYKATKKAVDSLKRREKRLARYGIEVKATKPVGSGNTHYTTDVTVGGNTYPVKDLLKKVGFEWDGSAKVWRIGSEEYYGIKRKFENDLARLLKKLEGDRPPREDPRAPQPGPDLKARLADHKWWKDQPFEDEADERAWRERMDPIERNARRFGRAKVESISDFLAGNLEERSGMDLRDVLKGMLFPAGDRLAGTADDFKGWANKTFYKKRLGHQIPPEERGVLNPLARIQRALSDFEAVVADDVFSQLQDLLKRGTISDRDQKKLMDDLYGHSASAMALVFDVERAIREEGRTISKLNPKLYKSMMAGPLRNVPQDAKKVKDGLSMLAKVIRSMTEAGVEVRLDVMIEAVEGGWVFYLADGEAA